jgi:F0F1-type ATP synthase membrane subunit b/b'
MIGLSLIILEGKLLDSIEPWANYPGLELWKFLNLAIFVVVFIFLLKNNLKNALAARRDTIKRELAKAHQEREQAYAMLSESESKLAHLDHDVKDIQEHARQEAAAEKDRLAAATTRELEKMKLQADRELETADRIARKELRQFLATRSIDKARAVVLAEVRPEDDIRIINESIGELRRARA